MPFIRTYAAKSPRGVSALGDMSPAVSGCVADGPKLLGAAVAALMLPGKLKLLPLAYAAVVISGRTSQSAQPGCAELIGLKGLV